MILDFTKERIKRGLPVKETDEATYSLFFADYKLDDGRTFSCEFYAKDWDDAEAHLKAIKKTAEVEGEIVFSIPAEFYTPDNDTWPS